MAKTVLLCAEFTGLATGYSNYYRHLAQGLHDYGFDVVEIGARGDAAHPQHRRYVESKPWTIYLSDPPDSDQYKRQLYNDRQQSHGDSVHGGWLYESVFKKHNPDYVIGIRDYWYDKFIITSPLSKFTNVILSPTVDSYPQNGEWIAGFNQADCLVFYNEWSENWWRTQSQSDKVYGTISPAAHEDYKPLSSTECREELGLPTGRKIASTVMRNQNRKRFPELFEVLSQTDWLLHCHTAFPDGNCWNLPELILQYGVQDQVFFTYLCNTCDSIVSRNYCGSSINCDKCKQKMFIPSGTNSVTEKQLAQIYSASDLYIQYHSSEGFGIPLIEAAACGVKTVTVKHSGQIGVGENLDSDFLEPLTLARDHHNNCFRAVPDNIELLNYLQQFNVVYNRNDIKSKYDEHYSWKKTVDQWVELILSIPPKNIQRESLLKPITFEQIEHLDNATFINLACRMVAQRPELSGGYLCSEKLECLNNGFRHYNGGNGYIRLPYTALDAYNEFYALWEEKVKAYED